MHSSDPPGRPACLPVLHRQRQCTLLIRPLPSSTIEVSRFFELEASFSSALSSLDPAPSTVELPLAPSGLAFAGPFLGFGPAFTGRTQSTRVVKTSRLSDLFLSLEEQPFGAFIHPILWSSVRRPFSRTREAPTSPTWRLVALCILLYLEA
ncbi:hypothetical protein HYQ46_009274 [Verticillium longisporum]|nr:hypothetical protein HYQ46_009274 [Verticillium longisporum]